MVAVGLVGCFTVTVAVVGVAVSARLVVVVVTWGCCRCSGSAVMAVMAGRELAVPAAVTARTAVTVRTGLQDSTAVLVRTALRGSPVATGRMARRAGTASTVRPA
ncbi:hypothetical protein TUM20985_55630 [Mycobacterium antarcticum]|nr:hypothetical protein TUM20985_55630 [Mycolicibacterium sp. TUM20985]